MREGGSGGGGEGREGGWVGGGRERDGEGSNPLTFVMSTSLPPPDGRDWLFLSASQDQHIHIWRMTLETEYKAGDITPVGHVTLLHECKGHAKSVQAIDVSSDRSKVSVMQRKWSTVNSG